MFIALDWFSGKLIIGNSYAPCGISIENKNQTTEKNFSLQVGKRCLLVTIKPLRWETELLLQIPATKALSSQDLSAFQNHSFPKALSHAHALLQKKQVIRWLVYSQVLLLCSGLSTCASHHSAPQSTPAQTPSLEELHEAFLGDLANSSRVKHQYAQKAFEKEHRFLRVENQWVAPMHSALESELWYMQTSFNKGFAIDSRKPLSTSLQIILECHKKFWFAIPTNTAALVFAAAAGTPHPSFTITKQKPAACETTP